MTSGIQKPADLDNKNQTLIYLEQLASCIRFSMHVATELKLILCFKLS